MKMYCKLSLFNLTQRFSSLTPVRVLQRLLTCLVQGDAEILIQGGIGETGFCIVLSSDNDSEFVYRLNISGILLNRLILNSVVVFFVISSIAFLYVPNRITERLLPSDYPADYALQLFDCLQGIVHTYLLPFGQSKSTLMHGMILGTTAFASDGSPLTSSKPSPAHRGKSHNNSSSSSNGMINGNKLWKQV